MTNQLETLEFSSTIVEIPVKIDDKDYILQEASGGAANVYNNDLLRGMTLGKDRRTYQSSGIAEINTRLLSQCLFEVIEKDGKPTRELVNIVTIKKWPDRIQTKLIEKLKEISNVDDDTQERISLLKALDRTDTPIPLEDFRTWVEKLVEEDEESYAPLWDLVRLTTEETAKNF